jgi:hypothetical protein
MSDLEILLKEWHGTLEDSRIAVLDELRSMASNWEESADEEDYNAHQDAKTMGLVVKILEHIERIER